jgi:hypothetical protein
MKKIITPNERKTEKIVCARFEKDNAIIRIEEQKSDVLKIDKLLKTASKKGEGQGRPEFIITFNSNDFLIAVECKDIVKHESRDTHASTFENIVEFHYRFEKIHPFQDGNGRVGRLILFRECLKNNIIPFIIDERHKQFYYRGLKEFATVKGYLLDTCLSAQDTYKGWINYFYGK